ncbi:MAG: hypothetical protein ACTS7E_05055 [Arsenophonus sp. NC-CH8-MAG3]
MVKMLPDTQNQRCLMIHKTADILDLVPKGIQPNVNGELLELWLTRELTMLLIKLLLFS